MLLFFCILNALAEHKSKTQYRQTSKYLLIFHYQMKLNKSKTKLIVSDKLFTRSNCHNKNTSTDKIQHQLIIKPNMKNSQLDKSIMILNNFAATKIMINKNKKMSTQKIGNPAVVGLAGFGLTTLLLQLHNIGLMGIGPVLAMGLIFGGLAQMIAGFMEQKAGNNFGFSAFVAYGSFWIGLGIIWLLNHYNIYAASHTDMGWYLAAWALYTAILTVASLYIHRAMFITFALLEIGFIFLVIGHFGYPVMNVVAGYELIFCALAAWYMMAGIIINDLAGKTVLPMGKALIKD